MYTGREPKSAADAASKTSAAELVLTLLPLGFMAAIGLATYAAIVWTLRHGFGWGDESFVYTLIASNRQSIGEAWGFQHLLHPLYILTGQSVLAFRVVRLAGYILLSLALVWAARLVVRQLGMSIPRSGWVFILILAQVGTFLAWSYPPRYLSYNELASWFVQAGVALILVSLAWGSSPVHDQRASPALGAIWAGLGGLTTLLIFAKVTSAASFVVILGLAFFVPNPYLRLWKRAASLGVGSAAVLVLLYMGQVPISFYLKNAYSLVFDKSVRDAFAHPTTNMISIYLNSLLLTVRWLAPAVLLFALIMATFSSKVRVACDGAGERRWGTTGAIDGVTWILGVLLFIALILLPRKDVWSYLGELVVFIGSAGIIGLAILAPDCAAIRRSRMSPFSVAVGAAAIVAAPFISALGTNNRLAGQFLFTATLWSVVLGITLVLLTQRATLLRSRARSLPSLIGCLVILLAAVAVKSDIANPYGTQPLLSQQTSTSVPEFRGILLTDLDATYISWVSAAGDSLGAANVPATAINSAGALYAFNHSGYANPWVGREWLAASNSMRIACTTKPLTDLFVLQPGSTTGEDPSAIRVTKTLAECGVNFPADFQVVAHRRFAARGPAMTIWRLKPVIP